MIVVGAHQRGAGLAELLTSLLFLSIVAAISYSFVRAAFMSAQRQAVKGEVQEVAVAALDLLGRDVRMAGFSAAAAPLAGLRAGEPARLEVVCDVNGDGDLADSNERIAYSYDVLAHQLMRATGGTSAQPVARHVSHLRFGYLDANGTEILPAAGGLSPEQCARVRRVDVELTVELPHPDAPLDRMLTTTATTSIQLRNR